MQLYFINGEKPKLFANTNLILEPLTLPTSKLPLQLHAKIRDPIKKFQKMQNFLKTMAEK